MSTTRTNLDSILKSRDITLPTKVRLVKAMVFPVVMCGCELDHKEDWAPKNWCLWTVVLEKTLESPLDCKEIKPVNPEGNQLWIVTPQGLLLKLKLQHFGHLKWRADSLEKTLMLGKIEGRRRRGQTEDEMVGWHHQLYGHEFGQALQGSLVCCSPWGGKELDTTEQLNDDGLLVSTRTSTQSDLAAWMGGESGKEWIHLYVWLSPLTAHWNYHHNVNWLQPNTK